MCFAIQDIALSLLEDYGYIALFFCLVFGIVGLPLPDETIMTFVGYLIYINKLEFIPSLITSFLGSAIGMTISYSLGKNIGLPLLTRFGKRIGLTEKKLARVNHWYERYGPIVLMVGYFIPGVRHVTAFTAGINLMRYYRFMGYAYSGGFLWALAFITLGYYFGENAHFIVNYIHSPYNWILLLIVILLISIIYLCLRRFRSLNHSESD
ncbi:MAG TPA: DedA family protein [Bacillota bacterium]|nr:DedA family protein [Bacillota bacterium]